MTDGDEALAERLSGITRKIDPWYLEQADGLLNQAHQSAAHYAQLESSEVEVEPDTLTAAVAFLFSLNVADLADWCDYQGFRLEEDGDDALGLTLFV